MCETAILFTKFKMDGKFKIANFGRKRKKKKVHICFGVKFPNEVDEYINKILDWEWEKEKKRKRK